MNAAHNITRCVHPVDMIVVNPRIVLIFLTAIIEQCALAAFCQEL